MLNNILAGPILRRSTQNRICVWLALDSELDLTLDILGMDETVVGSSKPEELAASRFRLGKGLFVYLLQAYSKDGEGGVRTQFSAGVPYYYRLTLNLPDGKSAQVDLQKTKLTYKGHKHPIFHIPGGLKSVLHGSCRKPHGDRHVDSLTVADTLLEKYYGGKAARRPDLLLLTGDQIYADDVAASLLAVLRSEAANLTGAAEMLPLKEYCDPAYDDPKQSLLLEDVLLGGRMAALKNRKAGFSSSEAYNHLLGFGEYAAMYIYAFGNARGWRAPESWAEIQGKHIPLEGMLTWQDRLKKLSGLASADKLEQEKQKKIEGDIAAVAIFGETLDKVRRLLANIPTYMIFDDHDVTDDWNITGSWYDKVRSSPMGRRIVSNALAAYWAFQGWGNDPDNFDADMIGAVTRYLNKTGSDPSGDERYDLLTWKHRGWGFSVPTSPPIIAMDSRTQRQSDNSYYPARLMDRYALDWLRLEWSKLKTSDNGGRTGSEVVAGDVCPVLIAATPVFGFSPLEHMVRLLLWIVSYIESLQVVSLLEGLINAKGFLAETIVDFLDAEAWTANLDGFKDFLDTVLHKMDIRKCVFLSGDVHYSFSATGCYTSKSSYTKAKHVLCCYQLTSSSLRNEPSETQEKALTDLQKFETGANLWQRFKRSFGGLQVLRRWQVQHKLLRPVNTDDLITEQCNLGEVAFGEAGAPLKHTLWHTDTSVEYKLPDFECR